MNRNFLVVLIAVLAIISGALGFWYYQEQQKSGVESNVDDSGVSIESN